MKTGKLQVKGKTWDNSISSIKQDVSELDHQLEVKGKTWDNAITSITQDVGELDNLKAAFPKVEEQVCTIGYT